MGKNGKLNIKEKTETKLNKQPSITTNDTSLSQSQIKIKNLPKEYYNEEKINKFNFKKNNISNIYQSRKCSKDSTSDSFSYEEPLENEFSNSITKFNFPQKQKFKSHAIDFKTKYKTELCKYYEIYGYCKYGINCAYAHGKENLRSKVTNTTAYRTRKCVQFFEVGYCPYGNRCQFAHQLESNILNNPYDRKMTYKKTMETISKIENVKNIKSLIEKSRLSVFEDIVQNPNQAIKSTLLEDIKEIRKGDIYERIDDN